VVCLKLAGAGRVWSVEPVADRREMARRAGADAVLDPAAADPVREILRDTGGRGVDAAIDCAAYDDTFNQCLHAARNAGRVILTGIPAGVRLPVEFSPMRRKELAIYNVRRSNHESGIALSVLVEHLPRFAPLITHVRPLARIGEAFDLVERRACGAGKVVIAPSDIPA
jgi:threonine dehydrogenase-like Zn-dependent dehydrogenase